MKKADLHIHSNCSDGSDSINGLINIIKDTDINIFALTDHDTVEGCKSIIKSLPANIKFLPGVELTCICDSIKCHILGYNVDIYNSRLTDLIEKGKVLRRQKLETRIKYLKDIWDIELTSKETEWLYSRKSVVKTHIANILVNRKLASNNIEAMKKYLDGCKTGNTRFDGTEAVKTIKKAGGIAIWAHPLGGEGETHISAEEFTQKLQIMKMYGIQGLECYYSRYNKKEIEFLVKSANQNNLFISGGSDYHGSNKDIPIGKLNTAGKPIDSKDLSVLKYILQKEDI